jgi:RNA polymerase sigma-70 factor (ECF subfamily)
VLRLNAKDGQACFRGSSTLDDSPVVTREVRLAIARAKEGDRDAVRFLYIRYSDNVYGYIRSIVRDEKDAEDITQQVFLKLMTVITRYEECGVPFSGWLLRVARNAALDHLRRHRAIPTEDVTATYGGHSDDDSLDRARSLRTALDALPEEQRNVVVMRHVIGLTPPEIAEQMGRSESSIHGLHHRGRRALKQELLRLQSAPSTTAATG